MCWVLYEIDGVEHHKAPYRRQATFAEMWYDDLVVRAEPNTFFISSHNVSHVTGTLAIHAAPQVRVSKAANNALSLLLTL